MISNLIADIRYSLRGFARSPTFAVVVVLTLSVAIGVNVAVFSLYDQLLLRQLPVADPGALVNFSGPGPQPGLVMSGVQGSPAEVFSIPMFRDLERADPPFAGIAASRLTDTSLGYAGRTVPGRAMLVSGQYFSVLGLGPSLGRLLGPQDDDAPGSAASVVLAYDYWAKAFGSNPAVLGTTLVVNGQPLEVVGVAPRGFHGTAIGERAEVFVPLSGDWSIPPRHNERFFYWIFVFGRLNPGVSLEEAQAAINVPYRAAVNDELAQAEVDVQNAPVEQARAFVEQFRAKSIELRPGAQGQSRAPARASMPLAIFLGATATILLIACVNVANLMFARGAARIGEMAVRTSMGAAHHRLLGLLAIEALLLAACAAVVSLPIALGALQAVGALMPTNIASAPDLSLSPRAVAVAFGIAAASTMVFALAPTLKLAGVDPARALQTSGSGRAFGGKGLGRFRFALSTSQIGLSTLLLVVAALFTQSLANIARVDLGLRTESLLTFTISPAQSGYTAERAQQLVDRLEEELAAQPGVTDVASSMIRLLGGSPLTGGTSVDGNDTRIGALYNYVGADYLRTLGIPLLAGRNLTAADAADRPAVAMVNESFVERLGLGPDPIGKRIRAAGRDDAVEIVGLFRDSALHAVKESFAPQLVMPRWQAAGTQVTNFYVRTAQRPEALLATIPNIIGQVDPDLPPTNVRTLESQIRNNVRTDWMLATVAGALAVVATLLAALGLYGVLSYTVAQRTREIGVRLALGAAPQRVRAMVLKHAAWMAGIGAPLGLAAALGLGRLAESLLFGLEPTSPGAFAGAVVLLLTVVLGASYLPARRASRVDPVVALRSE